MIFLHVLNATHYLGEIERTREKTISCEHAPALCTPHGNGTHKVWLHCANLNIVLLHGTAFQLICGGVHCWVAVRSKMAYGCSLAKLRVRTPPGAWMSVSFECCVL